VHTPPAVSDLPGTLKRRQTAADEELVPERAVLFEQ